MKRFMWAGLAMLAVLAIADTSFGTFFHHKKKAAAPAEEPCPCSAGVSGGTWAGGPWMGGGAPAMAWAPGAAYAGDCGQATVPQTVTQYRSEARTRTVMRAQSRVVTREVPETYTYVEYVSVTVPTKQMVTENVAVT